MSVSPLIPVAVSLHLFFNLTERIYLEMGCRGGDRKETGDVAFLIHDIE